MGAESDADADAVDAVVVVVNEDEPTFSVWAF